METVTLRGTGRETNGKRDTECQREIDEWKK